MGIGGVAKLSVDGKQVVEGRIGKTQRFIFSADETADVGIDNQTPHALGIGLRTYRKQIHGKDSPDRNRFEIFDGKAVRRADLNKKSTLI